MSFPPDPVAAPDAMPDGPAPRHSRHLLRRPLAAAGLALLIVAGGATAVAVAQSSAPTQLPALGEGKPAPDPVETTTTTTAPPPPVEVAAVEAPVVVAPPAPKKDALVRVGEIVIPKIGLVHPIYEGVDLKVVDHGPGHWPGSAMPGELGNAVFAGHRVTHSHPFRRIHELVPGDEIIFRTELGEFTYQMTRQEIVFPDDTWIVDPTDDATVTLFACHPPGSARQRIVVRGSFRKSSPLPPGAKPLG
jgi:sortase A